jgi:hypothetical protein
MTEDQAHAIAARLVEFLETGRPPDGLFATDVFCDFSSPRWRVQTRGVADVVALRLQGHPGPGRVPRWRCDPTPTGFVLEFEESWHHAGEDWYSREMARCEVVAGQVAALSIYCTGDWDARRRAEHAAAVRLLR